MNKRFEQGWELMKSIHEEGGQSPIASLIRLIPEGIEVTSSLYWQNPKAPHSHIHREFKAKIETDQVRNHSYLPT